MNSITNSHPLNGSAEEFAQCSIAAAAHKWFVVDSLIALGLAAMSGDVPVITSWGRKVLVRGSSQLLLDLAA